jgi:hypothetical protein
MEYQTTKKLTMKKLLFFISLLFIFSISSCDNSLSPEEELAFVKNLERRVQARKPFLDYKRTIKKVFLSRTGDLTFEGYIDYIFGGSKRNSSMKIVVKVIDDDFQVTKR